MMAHLLALVPRERAAQARGKSAHGTGDRIADRLSRAAFGKVNKEQVTRGELDEAADR